MVWDIAGRALRENALGGLGTEQVHKFLRSAKIARSGHSRKVESVGRLRRARA